MHLHFARDHLAAIVRPPSPNALFPHPRSQLPPNDPSFPLYRPSNNLTPYRSAQRTPHYRTRFVPQVQGTFEMESSQDLSMTAPRQINTPSLQRYSHRQLAQKARDLPRTLGKPSYSQDKLDAAKKQLLLFRSKKADGLNVSGQDSVVKCERKGVGQSQMVRRAGLSSRKENQAEGGLSSYSEVQLQQLKYYVPEVKQAVRTFLKDREFIDPHLKSLMESLSAFQMFAHLPLPPQPRQPTLPTPSGKPTLLLDLDETLLHSQVLREGEEPDWGRKMLIGSDQGNYHISLKIRPHAQQVLTRLKEHYELAIFTAGQQFYATSVLRELDPTGHLFSFRLFRQHCVEMQSRMAHVKDLRLLKGRDLSRVLLVDNSPHTYLFHKSNAVPIVSFFTDQQDTELLKLQKFLVSIAGAKDYRRVLQKYFKLDQYHHFNSLQRLVKELYP